MPKTATAKPKDAHGAPFGLHGEQGSVHPDRVADAGDVGTAERCRQPVVAPAAADRAGKLSAEGLTVNGAAYPGDAATAKDGKATK